MHFYAPKSPPFSSQPQSPHEHFLQASHCFDVTSNDQMTPLLISECYAFQELQSTTTPYRRHSKRGAHRHACIHRKIMSKYAWEDVSLDIFLLYCHFPRSFWHRSRLVFFSKESKNLSLCVKMSRFFPRTAFHKRAIKWGSYLMNMPLRRLKTLSIPCPFAP